MFSKTIYASWPHAQHGVIYTREANTEEDRGFNPHYIGFL